MRQPRGAHTRCGNPAALARGAATTRCSHTVWQPRGARTQCDNHAAPARDAATTRRPHAVRQPRGARKRCCHHTALARGRDCNHTALAAVAGVTFCGVASCFGPPPHAAHWGPPSRRSRLSLAVISRVAPLHFAAHIVHRFHRGCVACAAAATSPSAASRSAPCGRWLVASHSGHTAARRLSGAALVCAGYWCTALAWRRSRRTHRCTVLARHVHLHELLHDSALARRVAACRKHLPPRDSGAVPLIAQRH